MPQGQNSWISAGPAGADRCGRFAPSTTGSAHLGTLLSALLAWCDVRRFGGRLLLRLEDLDLARSHPAHADAIVAALDWLGLDFHQVSRQSAHLARHHLALAQLAAAGRLYACRCSRSELRARAEGLNPSPGRASASTSLRRREHALHPCAATPVDGHSWAGLDAPLRLRRGRSAALGDPIVRRRDGTTAYLLASVVDDAAEGVSHVVRGRDLLSLAPVQSELFRALGARPPMWRHHLLLCSRRGRKLAKLHGDGGWGDLGGHPCPRALCGWLAWAAGLRSTPAPTTPAAVAVDFDWRRVRRANFCVAPDGAHSGGSLLPQPRAGSAG